MKNRLGDRCRCGPAALAAFLALWILTSSHLAAAADFEARCAAPGVVKCVGFDDPDDFRRDVVLFPAGDQRFYGAMDATIKASGKGSLRFEIPSHSGANSSGYWLDSLGEDFGPGERFFVQFRQRFSKSMLATRYAPGEGWKQVILYGGGPSCANVELTTQNVYLRGYPQMYTACGSNGLDVDLKNGDFLYEQGDYNCHRNQSSRRGCAYYAADQWMTFYYDVRVGQWGTPTSQVQAYVAYQGKPLKKFIDFPDLVIKSDHGPADAFTTIQLTPYQTRKDPGQDHPVAYTWYDELIISTEPIAAPDGAGKQ